MPRSATVRMGSPLPPTWRDYLYDYWVADDAVTNTNLSSVKGNVALQLPVGTVSADGFQLSEIVSWATTNSAIKGIVAVVACTGYNPGYSDYCDIDMGYGWKTGFEYGIGEDGNLPPNTYLFCPTNRTPFSQPAPTNRDPLRSLWPGEVGVVASGAVTNHSRSFFLPDRDGPGQYETDYFSIPDDNRTVRISPLTGQMNNLRYKMIGLITGPAESAMVTGLWTEFGKTVPLSGGTVTEPGDGYRYHTFNSSDTLYVIEPTEVEYLVVAGGGAGAVSGDRTAGGGGAGGVLTGTTILSANQAVTIGAGGISITAGAPGGSGSNSSLGSIAASIGGGGGAGNNASDPTTGGSGGGGHHSDTAGAAGTSGQGNAGGRGYDSASASLDFGGGGGGGAGATGGAADQSSAAGNNAGAGGAGMEWPTSSGTFYAGGGGGSAQNNDATLYGRGVGGSGGGGHGALQSANATETVATAGAANSGGGGGGGADKALLNVPGAGGSGIVIVRYPV
jgi:hypothetical protein